MALCLERHGLLEDQCGTESCGLWVTYTAWAYSVRRQGCVRHLYEDLVLANRIMLPESSEIGGGAQGLGTSRERDSKSRSKIV